MVLLYYDDCFLQHDTGRHVEQPMRLVAAVRELARRGLWDRCRRPSFPPVRLDRLERLHDPTYVEEVRRYTAAGGGALDADTFVSRQSYQVALMAAGAACDAVEQVIVSEDRLAMCLVRPPGHHALADAAMGFCLFGNVAVAAQTAISEFDLDRVLVVDWDVHHGNGTQDAFYSSERVAFLSIHRWPFWPGTGDVDETGAGAGLGYNVNVPIRFGSSRHEFLARFTDAVERLADKVRPQLVLISAGFDAHCRDPIGSLGLETEDFAALTRIMLDVARTHAQGRMVSVLEGGYDPADLAANIAVHLETLLDQPL